MQVIILQFRCKTFALEVSETEKYDWARLYTTVNFDVLHTSIFFLLIEVDLLVQ